MVVKISASEHAIRFKRLLRYISALKDSWSPVAQSKGCYVQGVPSFSKVSNHKTRDITRMIEGTKFQESFTAVWTIGNPKVLLLLLQVEIFTTEILKEIFPLEHLSSSDCSHMLSHVLQ